MHPRKLLNARDRLPEFIPTDTRFQMLRLAQNRIKVNDLMRRMEQATVSKQRYRDSGRNLQLLIKNGLIERRGKSVKMTPLGEKVFKATRDILFKGETPTEIIPVTKFEKSDGKVYTQGPLTETFFGIASQKSFSNLLDLADEHKRLGKNWLEYRGGKTRIRFFTNLLRQGLVEFEKEPQFRPGPTTGVRGQAALWTDVLGKTRSIYEINQSVLHNFKNVSREEIEKIIPHDQRGTYTGVQLKRFRDYLVSKGVEEKLAEQTSPLEAKILVSLIHGDLPNLKERYTVTKMHKKGLLSKRGTKLRVTEYEPARAVREGEVKELFTTEQVLEYLRTLEKLLEEKKHHESQKT